MAFARALPVHSEVAVAALVLGEDDPANRVLPMRRSTDA
jgi:hypothetical protein